MDKEKIRCLLTSGCSFSDTEHGDAYKTWPQHLNESLNTNRWINKGRGGQSNKLIRMGVLYQVSNLLKEYKPEEILVAIMWSGPDRTALMVNRDEYPLTNQVWVDPHNFIDEPTELLWKPYLVAHSRDDRDIREYYEKYHNEVSSVVDTLHDILYCQTYLDLLGIKYYMSTAWDIFQYISDTFIPVGQWKDDVYRNPKTSFNEDPNISWIVDRIKWDKFLDVVGQWEWCHKVNPERDDIVDHHPSPEEHNKFVKELILPHIDKL
jgi:hypothetical protein